MIKVIYSEVFTDLRGDFKVIFDSSNLRSDLNCNQLLHVSSCKNVFRGMHIQVGKSAQRKIVSVLEGSILDFTVNIDPNSADFLKLNVFELNEKSNMSLDIPKTYAHGYYVISEVCKIQYAIDLPYDPLANLAINFKSKEFEINRYIDVSNLIVSERDADAFYLKDFLFYYLH